MALSSQQLSRYSRHILLPEVGRAGQERLRAASVLVVGMGGLGCPAALYLAAAGVGRLGLLDSDVVELSNLQRQILYGQGDLGAPKAARAAAALTALNPDLEARPIQERLEASNCLELLRGWDLVVEGTDNFASKFLVNDACVSLGIPLVQAGILRFEGTLMAFRPGGACYRCVFESAPGEGAPSCAEAGVLGAVAGVMGSLLCAEALKILLGLPEPLYDRMLCYNAREGSFRQVALKRRGDCPSCLRAGAGFRPVAEMEAPCP